MKRKSSEYFNKNKIEFTQWVSDTMNKVIRAVDDNVIHIKAGDRVHRMNQLEMAASIPKSK